MKYKEELTKAMTWLGEQQNTLFIGQSVEYAGTAMFGTLENIPMDKRMEMPVAEEFQMGFATGLALEGYVPISMFPRFDFLILGMNQLVNHLDKIKHISKGGMNPNVLIRTSVGSINPMNPGVQHCQDHTQGIKSMLKHVNVVQLINPEDIVFAFQSAYKLKQPTVFVEYGDFYVEK
jgi:pyruvate/2-oxoglutarate/acetoin dehydrogenase E1 component